MSIIPTPEYKRGDYTCDTCGLRVTIMTGPELPVFTVCPQTSCKGRVWLRGWFAKAEHGWASADLEHAWTSTAKPCAWPARDPNPKILRLRNALADLQSAHVKSKKAERSLQKRCGKLTARIADLEQRARERAAADCIHVGDEIRVCLGTIRHQTSNIVVTGIHWQEKSGWTITASFANRVNA